MSILDYIFKWERVEWIHYTDFEDEVVFMEEGRKVDMASSDFDDYRAKVNEYVEVHKSQPAWNISKQIRYSLLL